MEVDPSEPLRPQALFSSKPLHRKTTFPRFRSGNICRCGNTGGHFSTPIDSQSAPPVLDATPGAPVQWPDLVTAILAEYPDRYSPKMLRSLAQNCVSSWTQSGHLQGRVKKRRQLADPSSEAAAYAALLGSIAGFGGPALLRSPWMRLLDHSEADLLSLLRRAESGGLTRVKRRSRQVSEPRAP